MKSLTSKFELSRADGGIAVGCWSLNVCKLAAYRHGHRSDSTSAVFDNHELIME